MTPALWTSTPTAASPSATRSAIQRLDSRVSCPITAWARDVARTKSWPRARPIRYVLCLVSGNSPATPRMPSVPNSCRSWAWVIGRLRARIRAYKEASQTCNDRIHLARAGRTALDGPPGGYPHIPMKNNLVGCRGSYFLYDYGYAHGCGSLDLHEGVAHINVCGEDSAAQRTRCVDGIGGSSIDGLHVMARTG